MLLQAQMIPEIFFIKSSKDIFADVLVAFILANKA